MVFDEYNVVQPDLLIVCGELEGRSWIFHPPEVIFEVLSKSTAYKNIELKRKLYERFKVKECILVFPDLEIAQHFILKENSYGEPKVLNWDATLRLETFEVEISLQEVFERVEEETLKTLTVNST